LSERAIYWQMISKGVEHPLEGFTRPAENDPCDPSTIMNIPPARYGRRNPQACMLREFTLFLPCFCQLQDDELFSSVSQAWLGQTSFLCFLRGWYRRVDIRLH
jgi:hypothetical protein